jgi:hypothetical protein
MGEIFDGQYGFVFKWGIIVNNTYIDTDVQNIIGLLHVTKTKISIRSLAEKLKNLKNSFFL